LYSPSLSLPPHPVLLLSLPLSLLTPLPPGGGGINIISILSHYDNIDITQRLKCFTTIYNW